MLPAPASESAAWTAPRSGPVGTNVMILSSGGAASATSGPLDVEPDGGGERVGDAGVGRVGVGVRGEQRGARADEAVHERALRGVGADPVHAAQEQRVVGDEQLRAAVDRLVDGLGYGIDAHEHRARGARPGSPQTSPTASQSAASSGG